MKDMDGRIELILGPMFSGKTTELMRRIKKFRIAQKKCAIVSFKEDMRFREIITDKSSESLLTLKNNVMEKKLSTHDKNIFNVNFKVKNIGSIFDELMKYDIIGIDEGQFFDDITQYSEILANEGKIVLIASLSGNFKREPFGDIKNLMAKCEKIDLLSAVCTKCFSHNASFSYRLIDDKKEKLIGGQNFYTAVCRLCYHYLNGLKYDDLIKKLRITNKKNLIKNQKKEEVKKK